MDEQPPPAPPVQSMQLPEKPSKWPMVFGVIGIILGALGLLGSCCGVISPLVWPRYIQWLESMEGVVVLAATNRPDIVDNALLRAGRFDRLILIPAPDRDARLQILKIHTKEMPLDSSVNLDEIDLDKMAIDLDAEGLAADVVAARTSCRSIDYEIDDGKGKTDSKSFDTCRAADGSWEIL